MKHLTLLIAILFISLTYSCESEGEETPDIPVLSVLATSVISETGFQLNWSISKLEGFQSISIAVSKDKELATIIESFELDDITRESLLVSDLQGATIYYFRISLMHNGVTVAESDIEAAETSYRMESFQIVTEDAYSLSSKLSYLESKAGSRPGIIMMHEFGVWVNPWVGSDLLRQLVADGYVCLTFFFRGHGTSTPVDDPMDLINDKSLLTRDLQATIDYMNENELVSGELGLIGGSMGAIMALAGNGYEEVLTSVALSPTRDGVFLIFPNMTLSSVYYLVGELDIHDLEGGDFPAETNILYELTEEPRKLNIIPGTADHGTNLLSRDSLNTSIKEWFLQTLPMN